MIYSSTSRSSRWLGMIQFLKNWYNYYFSIQKMGNIAWNIYYKKKKKKKRKTKTKNKKCLLQSIALGVCIECKWVQNLWEASKKISVASNSFHVFICHYSLLRLFALFILILIIFIFRKGTCKISIYNRRIFSK